MGSTTILCDFDGTIAPCDVTDLLLEFFADPGWRDIEAQWQDGTIGSAICMARQVALMRCSRQALDRVLDAVPIDPGFCGFVEYCRVLGTELVVVSDGLDYAIHRILARAGIHGLEVRANRLLFLNKERFAMVSPHAADNCASAAGTCKCTSVVRRDECRTILIGDGRSDFCAARAVDFVVAKSALVDFCKSEAISHITFESFAEIPAILAGITATEEDNERLASYSLPIDAGRGVGLTSPIRLGAS